MLLYFASIAALAALVLGVCLLDGDFSEGGLFAEMAKQVRANLLGNLTSHTVGQLADAERPPRVNRLEQIPKWWN